MFKHILCAVDGSKHSLKSAQVAGELAARFGAELTFLTVTKDLKMTAEVKRYIEIENLVGEPQYVLDDYTKEVLHQARDRAREVGVAEIKTEVLVGHLARTIMRFAERSGVDAIVLGSRGHGDQEGVLLGSVSHKVTSLCKPTCIVVK